MWLVLGIFNLSFVIDKRFRCGANDYLWSGWQTELQLWSVEWCSEGQVPPGPGSGCQQEQLVWAPLVWVWAGSPHWTARPSSAWWAGSCRGWWTWSASLFCRTCSLAAWSSSSASYQSWPQHLAGCHQSSAPGLELERTFAKLKVVTSFFAEGSFQAVTWLANVPCPWSWPGAPWLGRSGKGNCPSSTDWVWSPNRGRSRVCRNLNIQIKNSNKRSFIFAQIFHTHRLDHVCKDKGRPTEYIKQQTSWWTNCFSC